MDTFTGPALNNGASLTLGNHKVIQPMAQTPGYENAEEDKLCKMIISWQKEDASARQQFDRYWDERIKAYKGRTWQNQKTAGSKSTPEINIIRIVVQTILPILTDANPGFGVQPKGPMDIRFVEMLSDAIESLWERRGMPIRIVETLMDQSILDCGIMKVSWNPDLDDGAGDIDIEPKDPRNIWVNKGAIDFDRECTRVTEKFVKTVGEWKRLFPDKADKIRADSSSEQRNKQEQERPTAEVTLVSPVDRDTMKDRDPGEGVGDDNSYAEGWEVWFEDSQVEEYELQDEDHNLIGEKVVRKKYPNGHLVTILPWQKLILQSVENPNQGPNFNPYVRFVDTILPRSFYGEGLVEPSLDLQKMLNKVAQSIVEYIRLMSNPVWILDKTSGVNTDMLTNKIGLVIKKEAGTEVRRDFPEPIPQYIFQFFSLLHELLNEVAGTHDITQGRKPAGITAAEAIESLQEAAHTRVRLKERNMQVSLAKLARLVIAMMLQKYRAPRYQRVSGATEEFPKFVEFGIDEMGGDRLQINRRNWVYDVEQGKYLSSSIDTATGVKRLYDVKVQAGTAMPFAKAQRSNLAIRLFEGQAIDQKALLDTLEWEKSDEVIERMNQAKAAAQQVAATAPPAA